MSEELMGAIVGGAIGLVAALMASAATFWFARVDERRKANVAKASALTSCRYETATIASMLVTVGVTKVPELVAIEQAINGGYLSEISQNAARELLLFRTLVHDLNETMTGVEHLSFAAISAGHGAVRNDAVVAGYERAKKLSQVIADRGAILAQLLAAEMGEAGPPIR